MKTIGKHTIKELQPHIKEISEQFNLKPYNVKDFKLIRKLLVQRNYSIPIMETYN